jgi:hypothetical protein
MQGNLCYIYFKPVDEIYLLRDWENEKINRAIHKNKDHDRYEWRRVCDASDANDATSRKTETNHKAITKAEEVGLPEIPCLYCNFKDPIAFDLSLHYLEKHRYQLIRLPIGKAIIDDRADYAVELSKKKLLESFEDEDEIDDDDAYEIEEDE